MGQQIHIMALAVCLAAGMEGIKNKILPPESVDENIYEMTDVVKNALGIEELPASLREAITEFQKDQFMQEVLGEELSQKLIESKRAEYREYRTQVTEWEINEYLQKF